MAYFEQLPDLNYPFLDDRDFLVKRKVKNLFRRAKIRDDIFSSIVYFEKYKITGDDRPDNVAEKVYGDPELDWVVLLSNNIINIYDQWPLDETSLRNYIDSKYTKTEQSQVKHYLTTEIKDSLDRLIRPKDIIVSKESYNSYSFSYYDSNLKFTRTLGNESLIQVTNFDYEIEVNEEKRNIFLVQPELISLIKSDMKKIMEYAESSQTTNKKIK